MKGFLLTVIAIGPIWLTALFSMQAGNASATTPAVIIPLCVPAAALFWWAFGPMDER